MLHSARMQVAQAATKSQVARPQTVVVRPQIKHQVWSTSILLAISKHVI